MRGNKLFGEIKIQAEYEHSRIFEKL